MKLGLVLIMAAVCACIPAKVAGQAALSTAQVLCVLASELTDQGAVLEACKIEQTLAPVVSQLLSDARAKGVGRVTPQSGHGK